MNQQREKRSKIKKTPKNKLFSKNVQEKKVN